MAASGPPWLVSSFRFRARLGFSLPSFLSGQRGITPAFGYAAPHPSVGGTSTLLNSVLLSTHYAAVRLLTKRCFPLHVSVYKVADSGSHPETLPVLLRSRIALPYRAARNHLESGG